MVLMKRYFTVEPLVTSLILLKGLVHLKSAELMLLKGFSSEDLFL